MDGACFGPALPHLFLMVYPEFLPKHRYNLEKSYEKRLLAAQGKAEEEEPSDPEDPFIQAFKERGEEITEEKQKELDRIHLVDQHGRKVQGIYQPIIDSVLALRDQLLEADSKAAATSSSASASSSSSASTRRVPAGSQQQTTPKATKDTSSKAT